MSVFEKVFPPITPRIAARWSLGVLTLFKSIHIILVIGDLGLWNGRRMGYREINSGNIRDCLYGGHDFVTWYVDSKGDLRCEDIHHDGTNYYLYRMYKPGSTQNQRDRLKEKIFEGTATEKDIARVTQRLGDRIGRVYGWTFSKEKSLTEKER